MALIQDIISVLPSIASIIAPLFNSGTNDYLRFGVGGEKYIHFKKDPKTGEIMICNPFMESVALEFPEMNGICGESLIVPPGHYPVTTMLKERAKANIDSVQIVKGGIPDDSKVNGVLRDGNTEATITATGKVENVPDLHSIGTSLKIHIDGNDLSICTVPPYTLESITSLQISGDGNQPVSQYKNVLNDGSEPTPLKSDGNIVDPLRIKFPNALSGFNGCKKLNISVSARCSYVLNSINPPRLKGKKAEDCDWSFLEKGRCLNE